MSEFEVSGVYEVMVRVLILDYCIGFSKNEHVLDFYISIWLGWFLFFFWKDKLVNSTRERRHQPKIASLFTHDIYPATAKTNAVHQPCEWVRIRVSHREGTAVPSLQSQCSETKHLQHQPAIIKYLIGSLKSRTSCQRASKSGRLGLQRSPSKEENLPLN